MSTVSSDQTYVPTLAILGAIQGLLEELQLPDPYTQLGNAFEDVRVYAHRNLGQALQDLFVTADRVALIIPTDFAHTNKLDGRNMTSRRTLELVLLIGDKIIGGNANEAAVGGQDNPGMVLLAELAINALAGADLGLPAVILEPMRGQPLLVGGGQGNDGDATFAREAWAQTFTTPAGERRMDRGRPSRLAPIPSPVLDNSGI